MLENNKLSDNAKNIIVGICGGISSYKTAYLIRILIKKSFSVKVVMTEAATKFVAPLVFQTLTNSPVYTEMFSAHTEKNPLKHIFLSEWADLCVIAPLSANTLSKISCGICDNLLTTLICALPQGIKVICAPAMNKHMWKSSIIQNNISKLRDNDKFVFINPGEGELASGDYGEGRMAEPEEIAGKIEDFI